VAALILEKSTFPRYKACGDGLTPRAVKELALLGLPTPASDGWVTNRGLRVFGGGHALELPWPELGSFPNYGLTFPRERFDQLLVNHAQAKGATFRQNTNANRVLRHPGTGRIVGVAAQTEQGVVEYRAPIVVDAGGVAARIATLAGRNPNPNRPMGTAIRARVRLPTPISPDRLEWLESHLELRDKRGLIAGYGWVFPEADNHLNIGLGSVSSRAGASAGGGRGLLNRWFVTLEEHWGITAEDISDAPLGAALPMGFNRRPLYGGGLMLLGDAAGLVSPFNGEGVAYAMLSARFAAESIADALARPTPDSRELALRTYSARLNQELAGYFTLGRVFVRLIEHPKVLHVCTKYGLPRQTLIRLVMKLLSGLYEPRGGDWTDRLIATSARLATATALNSGGRWR